VYDALISKVLSPACEAAVLAAIAKLHRFLPGKQNGQAVSVGYTIPVSIWGPNHVFENGQLPTPATFPAPGLDAYVAKNLRVPAVVKKENLNGQVQVGFVVGADGKVRDAKVERPLCNSCDQEALRLVQAMPTWTPARNAQGQPVPVHLLQNVAMQGPQPAPAQPIIAKPLSGGNPSAVYTYVEQMPQLPGGGGNAAIMAAIKQNLDPSTAGSCARSRVFVSFTVAADGSIANATLVKSLGNACDEAALAAVRKLPRFQAGKQNGRPVAVALTMPVVF
jgi:TonB family protein